MADKFLVDIISQNIQGNVLQRELRLLRYLDKQLLFNPGCDLPSPDTCSAPHHRQTAWGELQTAPQRALEAVRHCLKVVLKSWGGGT